MAERRTVRPVPTVDAAATSGITVPPAAVAPPRSAHLFSGAQFAFIATVLLLGGYLAFTDCWTLLSPEFLLGLALTAAATSLLFAVPSSGGLRGLLVLVPTIDILAVAFFRDTIPNLPTSGLLIVVPVLWLSGGFGVSAVPVAVLGTVFTSLIPVARSGSWPTTPGGWGAILLIPALVLVISVTVYLGARQLRAHEDRARIALAAATEAAAVATTVAESVDAAVAFFRPDGTVALRNQATYEQAELAGYDRATKSGVHVYGPDRRTKMPAADQVVNRALRGESFRGQLYWIGEPGNQRALIGNARQVHTADGTFVGTMTVGHDVTDLANAVAVREEFLIAVSHELRTPLTSIIGYLDLLSEGHDLQALGLDREVATIQRNAEQLYAIIGDLLAAGDAEMRVRIGRVDLAAVARESAAAILPRASDAGVAVRTELPALVELDGDAGRLRQVVDNLLSNAVKYTPSGGRVTLTLTVTGDACQLDVVDTGIGISPDDQRQLFDRFFRARAVRDDALPGVGLGLSIVKSIVEAHEGRIGVASRAGRGSTFTVVLPLRQSRTVAGGPSMPI
ncbi:PAS domain-containing sensor histidine kinase [Plantibacter flavus]|uniref:sensor histidine kinase n=1 Tax=Plantibacter flavus TaxID=150123 RepID=UPI003F169787